MCWNPRVPTIDPGSVDELIERMALHGPDPRGGMARVVYTPEWRAAVDELEGWCRSAGLATRLDAAGNLIGRTGGEGPAVATGSHIDTAVRGGRYDGTAGVVCGFLALASLLEEHGPPRRPVEQRNSGGRQGLVGTSTFTAVRGRAVLRCSGARITVIR